MISQLVLGATTSYAKQACLDIFKSKLPAKASQENAGISRELSWVSTFLDLRAKLLATSAIDLEKPFSVQLSASEKRHSLHDLILYQKMNLDSFKNLSAETLAQVPLANRERLEALRESVSSTIDKIRASRKSTYGEFVDLTADLLSISEAIESLKLDPLSEPSFLNRPMRPFLRGLVKQSLQLGSMPLFTTRDLNIRDFNYFIGEQIAPIGLISGSAFNDNVYRKAWEFASHDFVHNQAFGHGLRDRKFWHSLVETAESWAPLQRAAGHSLIFYYTHEAFSSETMYQSQKPRTTRLSFSSEIFYRMERIFPSEKFFGEHLLAERSDWLEILESVRKQIETEAHRLDPDGHVHW